MNIAYAKEGAKSLEDVAAFPGRITRVGRGIAAVSKPAWGASRHLGRILLNILQIRRDVKAIANIRVLKCVEEAFKKLGIGYSILGPREGYVGEEEIISEVSRSLSKDGVEAVIDLGGLGIEPVAYIAGRDPIDVARRITDIARICSEEFGIEC